MSRTIKRALLAGATTAAFAAVATPVASAELDAGRPAARRPP